MPKFQYYEGEEKVTPQQETQAATPASPINALQFFDDKTAHLKAWSGAADVVMEAGSVAIDIDSKLKEAEHQNKADEFFVDYTQRISALKDDIKQGNAKSDRYDMNDLNDLTNYYKEEEDKIYKDLSGNYNSPNYKRRDSLMRDRKATPFLNSMSSIRQNKIQEIARDNQEKFKLYLEEQTQELQDQSYDLILRQYSAQELIKKEGKESFNNENKRIDDHINNTISKTIQPEGERRYQQGTILKSELDDLPNKVRTNIQTNVAHKLSISKPEVFLAIHENEKNHKKAFGLIDPVTLAGYWAKADSRSRIATNRRELEASDVHQTQYIYELGKKLQAGNIDDLNNLKERLSNETDHWPNWTGKVRANAFVTLVRNIATINNREVSPDISRAGLNQEILSYKESYLNLEDSTLLESPLAKWDFKSVYKDPSELKQNTDRVKFLQEALPIFRKLSTANNHRETRREFDELIPSAKKWGTSYNLVKSEWEDLDQSMRNYEKRKMKDLPGVIRMERNEKQPKEWRSVNTSKEALEILKGDNYDMDGMIIDQLGYLGIKTNGARYTKDPNLLLQVPGFKLLTPTDQHLFSKLITTNNAPEAMGPLKELLKEKYGPLWSVGLRDLKRAGIIDTMMEYSHALDNDGFQAHHEAKNWNGNVGDFLSKNSNEYGNLLISFNETFASGIETFPPRDEAWKGVQRYYSMLKFASGEAPDIDETVKRYFSGIVLIDAPFHLNSHFQDKIWESQEFLDSKNIDADTFQDGMVSWMLTFRDSPDRIDDDLYVIGMNDIDPNYLTNLSPEQLKAYPPTMKLAREYRDELILANVGAKNPADQPFVSIVRNTDGETYALALKHHPVGGIFRLGIKDENGNIQPISGTREEFVEHGTRYRRRMQADMLSNEAGLFSGFFSQIPKDMTVKEWLVGARKNMKDSTALEVLDRLEGKLHPNEMFMKGTSQPLKDAARKLKEEIGETKELGFWNMQSWGNASTELFD